MATNTYVALDKKTITSAVAYIEFTGIPSTYTDLVIVANGNTDAATTTKLNVGNGSIDTNTNYSWTVLSGTGSAANSYRESSVAFTQNERYANWDATNNANTVIQLQNYSNTSTYKTWLTRGNNSAAGVDAIVGMWRSTSAVNVIRISCTNAGRTFSVGSTFSLYGIKANDNSYSVKATGGTITTDIGYVYHTFTSSGTFAPTEALSADILVVAGGGGGSGWYYAGGGGAGGLLSFANQSLSSTSYSVTVGSGGAGGAVGTARGTNGSDSIFGALTTVVGGGGGGNAQGSNQTGSNGGSGGGSGGTGDNVPPGATPGSATSGQGYNGGYGYIRFESIGAGGGGGGASATGGNGSASTGGNGGSGSSSFSTWGSATSTGHNVSGTYYYAGGGGGGGASTGGSGGNGGGASGRGGFGAANGIAGTANTGGGGGGADNDTSTGGAGGSGIVIVRYAK